MVHRAESCSSRMFDGGLITRLKFTRCKNFPPRCFFNKPIYLVVRRFFFLFSFSPSRCQVDFAFFAPFSRFYKKKKRINKKTRKEKKERRDKEGKEKKFHRFYSSCIHYNNKWPPSSISIFLRRYSRPFLIQNFYPPKLSHQP